MKTNKAFLKFISSRSLVLSNVLKAKGITSIKSFKAIPASKWLTMLQDSNISSTQTAFQVLLDACHTFNIGVPIR